MVDQKKPEFSEGAGQYRTLRRPKGQKAGATVEGGLREQREQLLRDLNLDRTPPEWYEEAIFHRRHQVIRTRGGKVHPRTEVKTREIKITAGMALGGLGLVFLWEVGQSIAHGLAQLDPLSWADDIETWIEGGTPKTSVATASVGGIIEAALVQLVGPSSTSTSSSSSGGSSGSGGGGVSIPPIGSPPVVTSGDGGLGSNPPVQFDALGIPYCPLGYYPKYDALTLSWRCEAGQLF